jgi:hypothetical protein
LVIKHVGIVSQSTQTDPDDVARAAAALNTQVLRDFAPEWGIRATVQVYSRIREMPFGSWLMLIRDNIHQPGLNGFHRSFRGLPFAMIQYSHSWSLDASHELLEMLADPTGSELEPGQAPSDSFATVEYLREVCDPCQSEKNSYTINSYLVSDFITRRYYDTVKAEGVSYSFKGQVPGPRELAPGGYLTYRELTRGGGARWIQWFEGSDPKPMDGAPPDAASVRTWVDGRTEHPDLCGVPDDSEPLAEARAGLAEEAAAREALAAELEAEIKELVDSYSDHADQLT